MSCDKYLELLALRLDGGLSAEEDRELEAHLAVCPGCRAAGAQLTALQEAFPELEGAEPPEGFARGVMDRIRAEESGKKIVPLFKRPQVRALAGLAACLVLVVGLYGASRWKTQEKTMLVTRNFQQDVQWEETTDGVDVSACEVLTGDESGPQVNASLVDPQLEDAPQITAYSASSQTDGAPGQKAAPNAPHDRAAIPATPMILTLDCMPEGGWDLIPPETPVSPDGLTVSVELMEQLEQLAREQEITTSRTSWPVTSGHCLIVILDEAE